ncbi:MAG: cyclic nucleotide-binding domain-containing protein [Bacteroidales bacterium]|nr:cyclic nucleotide-binding domain-containing protein [Bacteroidales bacterium]MCF8350223.1 cyclic nucleotide-binding domain-containing protein [Bacteroidales bacterium]MCF8375832.1 cyclic nucleotide-binding domain-containing protein [Bacteroidales bacterium]MCF8402267.1 cyclic nucleotide-binding domain-containing protein [Bacteroidales bacterium]
MPTDKLSRRIKVLKQVSIFEETRGETLKIIAEALDYEFLEKDKTIVHKGEIGNAMFIIESGTVKVHDADYIFSVLKEDDVFGEYYLIDSEERSASVTTLEKTELLRINQETFYRLMARDINITRGILKSSVGRLRRMNEVEEELARKNIEIENRKKELLDLNATKDKFFSIIAHDVRSPLGTIISFFEFLNSNVEELDKMEIVDLVKSIYTSTDRLLKLLDNLLQWSRIQTGELQCKPENFDIRSVVLSNIDLLKMNAEKKGINLYSEIDSKTMVNADVNMTNAVLRNLISNGIKFTGQQGSVWVSSKRTNGKIAVSVHDTGIGISKENLKKLFRIDLKHSTPGTEDEKGTGLGLNLCKEFVEKNGGRIKVESKPGEGTVITFTVPLK